jgi:acetolactate synthase-1/2/3 large subunit
VLHLTGQIDTPHLDKNRAFIHEARDQLGMLKAVSKAAFRVASVENAMDTVRDAIKIALSAPTGPVSVEIPIDLQKALIPAFDAECSSPNAPIPSKDLLDDLAERLAGARRPLLWLGGGARHAGEAVRRLVDLGFGVVTSTQGRGVLPEDHPMSLGAFNAVPTSEAFYKTCDAMVVVGSRLRGNETLGYKLALPQPLYQIDADPESDGRCYDSDLFIHGDSSLALSGLADRLEGRTTIDPSLGEDLAAARTAGEVATRKNLSPYDAVFDALEAAAGGDFLWARDITLSNSMWGNRMMALHGPRDGVHATGGGIGQGLPMAIGAAMADPARRTLCLTGDGGLQLCIGELATLAESGAQVLVLVMNDQGYGVIRNIQDAHYGGRGGNTDILTPNFSGLCASIGLPHRKISSLTEAGPALTEALAIGGPVMVEVDMTAIGGFATRFAGPPVRTKAG